MQDCYAFALSASFTSEATLTGFEPVLPGSSRVAEIRGISHVRFIRLTPEKSVSIR